MLIISAVLAVLPLIAIAYMFAEGSFATVDNLFYILILLAMSGIFALNAYLESRDQKRYRSMAAGAAAQWTAATGLRTEGGLVESVVFYESPVGQADRSIVTLRPKRSKEVRVLAFEGDLRNQLPVGHQVRVTFGPGSNDNQVLALSYK